MDRFSISVKDWLHYFCYFLLAYMTIFCSCYFYVLYKQKWHYDRFCMVLSDEGMDCNLSYPSMKQEFIDKYPTRQEKNSDTIPLIQHFVYAFGNGESRSISDYKITKMIKTIEKLNQSYSNWQHYIWTNDPTGIPDSILSLSNVKIKVLDELSNSILYQDIISDFNSSKLSDWVQGSDLVRVAVLQKEGGIYFDCDVEVFKPRELYELMKSFDLILGEEPAGYKIGNAIMAAVPNHQVMNNATQLMLRNLHQNDFQDVPGYLKNYTVLHDKVIFETGPTMITVAYYMYQNSMAKHDINTQSIVLPSVALYNFGLARKQPPIRKGCRPPLLISDKSQVDYNGIKVESIVADPLCGTWSA